MYKPIPTTNRVKTIKSKFEKTNSEPQPPKAKLTVRDTKAVKNLQNLETRKPVHNGSRSDLEPTKPSLERQLSDPLKRNIKRTPAFRLDKAYTEQLPTFQRNSLYNRSVLFESKVKQFNSARTSDNVKKLTVTDVSAKEENQRPLFVKSHSSVDFAALRSRFNSTSGDSKTENGSVKPEVDISLLYTEPIPKRLRNNNKIENDKGSIYTASTLRVEEKSESDTLKALKKPLPQGPPPKKPPRTFQHNPPNNLEKNDSFLHKEVEVKLNITEKKKKSDPKQMLNKLEQALKNNKLRTRRPVKVDVSCTSGEDSDDSLLFKSKTRSLSKINSVIDNDIGCLGLSGCVCSDDYNRLKDPCSTFFVDRKEEPLYAEPFHHLTNQTKNGVKPNRNSLYYMSSPVFEGDGRVNGLARQGVPQEFNPEHLNFGSKLSAESSSLSSFTSDLDSPMDDPNVNVKNMIGFFDEFTDNNNRVENLKNTLQRQLEKSFSDVSPEAEAGNVTDIVSKFQTYIKSVPKYCQPVVAKNEALFYCCLVVERNRDVAHIKYKFPSNVSVPQNIESLCFPETSLLPVENTSNAQSYSLLITNDKGERMFGYCRRVKPEGSQTCLPLAYCILSKYRSPRFYKKILVELESRHGIPDKSREKLVSLFYNQKFPEPGKSIKVDLSCVREFSGKDSLQNCGSYINKCGEYGTLNRNGKVKDESSESNLRINEELILTLHHDTRYEDADLKILHTLPTDVILKIFASLLLERKVILISSVISDLSTCVDSLQSILYPFSWHHTFIPILPENLWDIVESPTPVICGCLSASVVETNKIENGIAVDLDRKTVLLEEGDENKILCGSMYRLWKKSIEFAVKASKGEDYAYSVYLSDSYLKVFILCFKNYKSYFEQGKFQTEKLIQDTKSKGVKRFLRMFTETFMFHSFVDSYLSDPKNFEYFDKKIRLYETPDPNLILQKLSEWKGSGR